MRYKTLILAIATALGMISASLVKADHQYVKEHTEQLECTMNELRTAFWNQFGDSGVYRELRSAAWDIRNDARLIERLARRGAPTCDLRDAIDHTDEHLFRLQSLISVARYRADTGIDPPLDGCTLHVDAKIASAREAMTCLRTSILGPVVYAPRGPQPIHGNGQVTGWQAQRPQYPGYVPPQAPVPGYNGTAPGYQPGYVPRNGNSNGTLPRGQHEEIGPPLTGHGHGPAPALVNPRYNGQNSQGNFNRTAGNGGQPIGIYGQRGNGIEMGNNGVVLKIGGAAIRF